MDHQRGAKRSTARAAVNRVWALLFGAATFLFWHLLLNQNDAYLDALRQTRVMVALGLVLLYGGLTVATWLFFRVRNRSALTGEVAGAA